MSGIPLFSDYYGHPINFKLLCDPSIKLKYKRTIEKHGGQVMKCQNYPRLLLAPKIPCEHLHVGCENHAPYTAAPVFNVVWIDQCIETSQVLDIKAYILNPRPEFALVNYMELLDEGKYRPPLPSSDPFPRPAVAIRLECDLSNPLNRNARHIQDVKAVCSRILRRSTTHSMGTGRVTTTTPNSSDDEPSYGMQRFTGLPSSTPRVPPVSDHRVMSCPANDTIMSSPGSCRAGLGLPLSLKAPQPAPGADPDVSALDSISLHQEPPSAPPLVNPSMEQQSSSVSSSQRQRSPLPNEDSTVQPSPPNRLSLSTRRRAPEKEEEKSLRKSQPRRRELFNSEHFAPQLSDVGRSSTPSPPTRLPPPSSPPVPKHPPGSSSRNRVQPTPVDTNSEESDSDFGPPPDAVLRVKGIRQNTRAPYTREEERTILRYIKASRKFTGLQSNVIWRKMDGKPGLERRSMMSLKEHFIKKMLPQLEIYNVFTEDEIRIMKSRQSE